MLVGALAAGFSSSHGGELLVVAAGFGFASAASIAAFAGLGLAVPELGGGTGREAGAALGVGASAALPGRKASIRSSVMVNPAYSSGARLSSLRPCTAIW